MTTLTDAERTQIFQETIKSACETFYNAHADELTDLERITTFVSTLGFELPQGREEIIEQTMAKNLHTLLYEDVQLKKMKNNWCNLFNSKVDRLNGHSFAFGVGDASPETKKNHISLSVLTKSSVQAELLQKNLPALVADSSFPLIALKIYNNEPTVVKAFAEQMMEMFGVEAIFSTLPICPEVRFVAAEDHLIIEVTAKKSLELNFMTYLLRAFISKLPQPDIEFDLNVFLGTNFADLINNHTENTIHDLLNGLRINIDFKNNLSGFFGDAFKYFFSKVLKDEGYKNSKIAYALKACEFVAGGICLNTNLNLNMGANEAQLMAKIPTVNIFDKDGLLSKTPISQAKMMMDGNEMFAPILELLKGMEGKGELYLFSPLAAVHGEVDVSGILDLVLHVINLFAVTE